MGNAIPGKGRDKTGKKAEMLPGFGCGGGGGYALADGGAVKRRLCKEIKAGNIGMQHKKHINTQKLAPEGADASEWQIYRRC